MQPRGVVLQKLLESVKSCGGELGSVMLGSVVRQSVREKTGGNLSVLPTVRGCSFTKHVFMVGLDPLSQR